MTWRALAVLLATAVLAACGSSPRLSHGELVRRATAICREQARKVNAIPRGPSTAINAAGYLGTVLSVVERGVKEFHALRPSTADEQAYAAFLRELDRNTDVLRTLRAAAGASDKKDYVIGLADLHRSRLRIDMLERRLGLGACAGA
jgi:hypothetical protein